MRVTTGWRSTPGSTELRRVPVERRDLREDDIAVRIDFCGVCHSDLHVLHGLLNNFDDGVVPGHEMAGVVTAAGSAVTRLKPGDPVLVGTIVDSCGSCAMCRAGQENYCYQGATSAYGSTDRADGTVTQGGFSREYVLREAFAYPLPDGLEPAAAAPLMCAGVSVWEPMLAAGVGPGTTVAVAGLGGLGHVAVRIAAALGAEVTVLSRTADKAAGARRLGASGLLLTSDDEQLRAARDRFGLVLDTIAAPHDLSPLLKMVAMDGTLSLLGAPIDTMVRISDLTYGRKRLTSSGTGGRTGTAEMLAFCATHGITADVEVLPSAHVQEAVGRLEKGDVRYRFVLDLSDLG